VKGIHAFALTTDLTVDRVALEIGWRNYLLVHKCVEVAVADELGNDLQSCEQRIGYEFRDKSLLRCALTHASGAEHRLSSNERLEFLGDAILGSVVCEILYSQFPQLLEGDLTQIKSAVVSRQTCAKLSSQLEIEAFIIVGRGLSSGTDFPSSLLSNTFESLVAAIYLDGGAKSAKDFIQRLVWPEIELAVSGQGELDYKSMLQQQVQRQKGMTPTYVVLEEKGPDHSKYFLVAAVVSGNQYTPAWGKNKKEAEQKAASNALTELNGEVN